MVGENLTPAAERSITGGPNAGVAAQSFDLQRFGMEVANEIGVDPTNVDAYGLSADAIDRYEKELHSGKGRGNQR